MYIALSLFIPYFLGLGLLVQSVVPASLRNIPKTNQEVARFLSFTILLGISINHLIMLFILNMNMSLIIGALLSVVGFCYAMFFTRGAFTHYFKMGYFIGIATFLTTIVFIIVIVNTQLGWDAQYIWFFHGKMIFFNNGLYQTAGWSNPAYQFSHVDYPKLLAILAAQFSCLVGYWNDYVPRLSLLILLVPAVLGVASFSEKITISYIYLYLMVFFSINEYTTNGYMDAYLAIYASISLLFFWRWAKTEIIDDFLTGFAFLAIIPLMKNEGMLYLLSVTSGFVLSYTFLKDKKYQVLTVIRSAIFRYISAVLVLNIMLWSWIKYAWDLKNDLNLGVDSITLITDRISDGSMFTVLRLMLANVTIGASIIILLFTVLIAIKSRVFYLKDILLSATVTSIYFAGIFVIYMATPHDLSWHLTSSTYRTMMPVNMSIITITYMVLATIDSSRGTKMK
ncbi:MAG: hypothetical protein HGB32_08570 [Geobacteraceae bacterium]|nr:hypothetical protein [Geobacteraceae bacterium]